MSRLDELIADLTSARISRRQFMQRAAALGLTVPMLTAAGSLSAFAQGAKNKVVWVSPRGTLEVLDDYPYWVGKKMGYFGDIETEFLPAILEARPVRRLLPTSRPTCPTFPPASSPSASKPVSTSSQSGKWGRSMCSTSPSRRVTRRVLPRSRTSKAKP